MAVVAFALNSSSLSFFLFFFFLLRVRNCESKYGGMNEAGSWCPAIRFVLPPIRPTINAIEQATYDIDFVNVTYT